MLSCCYFQVVSPFLSSRICSLTSGPIIDCSAFGQKTIFTVGETKKALKAIIGAELGFVSNLRRINTAVSGQKHYFLTKADVEIDTEDDEVKRLFNLTTFCLSHGTFVTVLNHISQPYLLGVQFSDYSDTLDMKNVDYKPDKRSAPKPQTNPKSNKRLKKAAVSSDAKQLSPPSDSEEL